MEPQTNTNSPTPSTESLKAEKHHIQPKKIAPIVLVLVIVITASIVLFQEINRDSASVFSGTIEAVEVRVGTELGGQVRQLFVKEGDRVKSGQTLVDLRSAKTGSDKITAPSDGTVMQLLVETGEITSPGSVLLILSNLETLTLTVYVPEDRYGQIFLGQTCDVRVDSYPDTTFPAVVNTIASQAEFTPRNVSTTQGRKSTVFAIKLSLSPSGGKLKPGMPADVRFHFNQ